MRRPAGIAAAVVAVAATLARAVAADAPTPPIAPDELRSGYHFQSPATRAMQDDEFDNPGLLWVGRGESLWREAAGATGQACADCHGDPAAGMAGVAARYPAVDAGTGELLNLEARINRCRVERQGAPALAYDSAELLALSALVAYQSRGLPIRVAIDGPARPFFEAGRSAYTTRQGQLNLACSHCHDDHWGERLRGELLSQGHPTGYPIYRLEWQGMGSLHRRLRSCDIGVRAEPGPLGAPAYVALELYLAWRAQGLAIETPAVRR